MGILNLITKNNAVKADVADSTRSIFTYNDGIINFDISYGHKLSASKVYDIYEKDAVVFDAVDKIASRVAGLTIISKDADDEIVSRSKLEILLKNPNGHQTKTDFIMDVATSLLLKEESWLVARGRVSSEPLELDFIKPYEIQESWTTGSKMPEMIKTDSPLDKREYKLTEEKGMMRYLDEDGLNELIPIIGKKYKNDWRGLSRLSPLVMEISHIRSGNIHNKSLLNNGINPSLILSAENNINTDVGEELADLLHRNYAGATKSGKPLLLPRKFHLLSKGGSTKDMEYMQLIDVDETRIYRLYNVPLPLVKAQSMTQSNYEQAVPAFYSEAVFPLFNYIAEQLTLKLGFRFGKDLPKLTYNQFDIPALNAEQVGLMSKLKSTNAVSTNEIRQKGGYKPTNKSDDVGDKILIPANMVDLEDVVSDSNLGFGDGND